MLLRIKKVIRAAWHNLGCQKRSPWWRTTSPEWQKTSQTMSPEKQKHIIKVIKKCHKCHIYHWSDSKRKRTQKTSLKREKGHFKNSKWYYFIQIIGLYNQIADEVTKETRIVINMTASAPWETVKVRKVTRNVIRMITRWHNKIENRGRMMGNITRSSENDTRESSNFTSDIKCTKVTNKCHWAECNESDITCRENYTYCHKKY